MTGTVKNMGKRAVSLILALVLAMGLLSGCGESGTTKDPTKQTSSGNNGGNGNGTNTGNKNQNPDAVIDVNLLYKGTKLDFDLPLSSINSVLMGNDTLYVVGYDSSETYWAERLVACDLDGGNVRVIYESITEWGDYVIDDPVVYTEEVSSKTVVGETIAATTGGFDGGERPDSDEDINTETYLNGYWLDENGNLILMKSVTSYNSDYSWYETQNTFSCVNSQGETLWEAAASDNLSWIESAVAADGGVVLISNDTIYRLKNGVCEEVMDASNLIGEGYLGSMVADKNGKVYLTYTTWTEQNDTWIYHGMISALDLDRKTLGEATELPWANGYKNFTLYPGGKSGYDLLLSDESRICGYNFGDAEVTPLVNLIDSGISVNYITSVSALSAEEFYLVGDDYDYESTVMRLTKVDPSTYKERKVLVLGEMYQNTDVTKMVMQFNEENTEYQIRIKNYSDYANNSNSDGAVTELNNDLANGRTPDILVLNEYYMDISSMLQKGAFENLYTWIDQDAEISRSDLLENVLESMSSNGLLYAITPTFYLQTYVGKTSVVGNGASWTLEAAKKALAANPGSVLLSETDRAQALNTALYFCGSDFMNLETGECHFDSQEFIDLLEFTMTFPESFDYDKLDDDYWLHYETQYRENRVLLYNEYLGDVYDLKYVKYNIFGEEVSYVGWPTTGESSGSALQINTMYAMSASSAYKEGAWAFLRQFLGKEYRNMYSWGFSIREDILADSIKNLTQKSFYLDENGEKVEYDDYYYVDGKEYLMEPMTQEEADRVNELMHRVNRRSFSYEDVLEIITEEVESFYAGQKSAKDVANIIQSRVRIFLAERS